MRIVVAGGAGFLGSALTEELTRNGWTVTVLTRRPAQRHHVRWDPYGSITGWAHALEDADAVVNLTGASINKRWTAAHKRDMWNSRVTATHALVAAAKSVRRTPPVFISGSAVGIYGPHGDEPVTEETAVGSGFLADLGSQWEKEALGAGPQARVVLVRTGIVLDRYGGALPQMALPFWFFAGGPLGSGRQYISWIHKDDWTAMVRWALANSAIAGPMNATAPGPVTNLEFVRTLGRALGRPALVPAPAFAIRLALGEMADVVLTGQRVFPDKARALGFDFRYPTLEAALHAVYAR
ncbi:MAG TPA: TIGR01777 family oxidoreductase [Vicinamibacterales bacterium]